MIRSHHSPPTNAQAYDWVARAWKPIPDAAVRRVDRRSWRPLTRVDVEGLLAEP